MDKQKLVRFISKYYLNGIAESVILKSDFVNQKLKTRFVSDDKTLLGIVQLDKWDFEEAHIGIYNTERLLKLLSVMDTDIKFSITKSEEKALSMKIADNVSSVDYVLSDPSIINEPPDLQNIPDFELSIHITPTVINKFIAGKSALQDATTFTVITTNDFTKLVIGHSATLTDRVTIPVNTQDFKHIKEVSFNAEYFSQILLANKECESAILYVSSAGLCKISFKIDNYSSTYWLVGTSELA